LRCSVLLTVVARVLFSIEILHSNYNYFITCSKMQILACECKFRLGVLYAILY
jgi:hypothetical protein